MIIINFKKIMELWTDQHIFDSNDLGEMINISSFKSSLAKSTFLNNEKFRHDSELFKAQSSKLKNKY